MCPLTCLNGGVCLSRKYCHCPPGFGGRLCQFALTQTQQAQAARGNKQPIYPISLKPDSLKLVGETSIGRTQMTQTHSVFTLPLSQGPDGNSAQAQVCSPSAPRLRRTCACVCFQCSLTCAFTTRRTPRWSFIPSTSRTSRSLTRAARGSPPPGTYPRAAASRRPRPSKL